jgi:antitoxin component HigA of HigAB toxin-antitoxin module
LAVQINDLVRAFPLRPIRSDDDHVRAIAAIDALADRRDEWGTDEDDYFLVLALLIERYEDEIYEEDTGAKPRDHRSADEAPADAGAKP